MGEIYAHSQKALVWLGEETMALSTSFIVVEQLHQFFLANDPNYPYAERVFDRMFDRASSVYQKLKSMRETWRGPLCHLITQTWFSRRWIIQEICKVPKAIVISGLQTISWETLGNVSWCLYRLGALIDIFDFAAEFSDPMPALGNFVVLEMIRGDVQKQQCGPILYCLIATKTFHCIDPRDTIYSLLGIAGDLADYGHSLIPDYSLTAQDVFKRFVTGFIVQKTSLHILSMLYVPPMTGALDLPSWVFDFSRLQQGNVLMCFGYGDGVPFQAGGASNPRTRISDDGNLLYAWGTLLDVISKRLLPITDMPLEYRPGLSPLAIRENRFRAWLSLCRDMYGDREEKFDSFWRAMIFNLTEALDRPPPEFGIWFKEYLDYALGPNFSFEGKEGEDEDQNRLAVQNTIINRQHTWGFCETEKGRFGQVMKSTLPGDLVCILYGGEVPYIIRPRGDGTYMFVGSCFIHGLMDGQGCEMEGVKEEEFCFS